MENCKRIQNAHGVAELPPLENLLVAALYLATNFTKSGCPRLSHMLLHQLEYVVNHPCDGVSPMVVETCRKLHETWQQLHDERLAQLESEAAPPVVRSVH